MSELSYGAVHLRSTDRVALIENLHAVQGAEGFAHRPGGRDADARGARRFLLLPPQGGWTTLLPEEPAQARGLARDLATVGVAALALVHVDDTLAFGYEAYGPGGSLVDAYHSCPDAEKAFDEADVSEAELERTRGNPTALAGAFGVAAEGLSEVSDALAAARIENLRDHDPSSARYDDVEEPKRLLLEALGLPSEEEGFPELWELGLFEEQEHELRALVYGPGGKPKRKGLRGWFGRGRDDEADAGEADPDELDDEQDESEDSEDDDLEDSRDQ